MADDFKHDAATGLPVFPVNLLDDIRARLLDEKTFSADIQGEITSKGERVFNKLLMEHFVQTPRLQFERPAQVVWIAVDPSAGHALKSRCSAVAVSLTDQGHSVVSCAIDQTGPFWQHARNRVARPSKCRVRGSAQCPCASTPPCRA